MFSLLSASGDGLGADEVSIAMLLCGFSISTFRNSDARYPQRGTIIPYAQH
jgi:hypothetical protein